MMVNPRPRTRALASKRSERLLDGNSMFIHQTALQDGTMRFNDQSGRVAHITYVSDYTSHSLTLRQCLRSIFIKLKDYLYVCSFSPGVSSTFQVRGTLLGLLLRVPRYNLHSTVPSLWAGLHTHPLRGCVCKPDTASPQAELDG